MIIRYLKAHRHWMAGSTVGFVPWRVYVELPIGSEVAHFLWFIFGIL